MSADWDFLRPRVNVLLTVACELDEMGRGDSASAIRKVCDGLLPEPETPIDIPQPQSGEVIQGPGHWFVGVG
jgi:hypothetical protein